MLAGMAELVIERPLPVADKGSDMLSEITSIGEVLQHETGRLYFRPDDA